jgi:hypothetical protein
MKNQPLLCGMCMVVLVSVLFTAGCTLTSGGNVTPSPVPATVTVTVLADTPAPATCGFTTCHGSDLACSTNVPEVCTMEYRIGDRCRQYARCDTSIGSCTLVISTKFTTCKACAERCQIQAGPDSLAAMTCEEKC